MATPYFPDPPTAWLFCGLLAILLAVATVIDLRTMRVPKSLTLSLLALGVVANAVRLGRMGLLSDRGSALGVLDGVWFAMAGFLLGFTLFTVMWLLGVVGGGDVKLVAALGAWLGPALLLWAVLMTLFVTAAFTLLGGVVQIAGGRLPAPRAGRPKTRLLTFSLPLTFSVLLVMAWFFRADLGGAPRAAHSTEAARADS